MKHENGGTPRTLATRWLSVAMLGLTLGACAHSGPRGDWMAEMQRSLWDTPGFLSRHPDVLHRKLGFMHEEQGDLPRAAAEFREAAKFADKASQAMLAEMYFEGRGVTRDPALAYAWMDLAAERGYRLFLAKREQYWKALDPAQQQAALVQGQALYAEFGDSVAKPRLERILRVAQLNMKGGRAGRFSDATVVVRGRRGWMEYPGAVYYHARNWKPERYLAWTDEIYGGWPQGQVEVGPIEPQSDESGQR